MHHVELSIIAPKRLFVRRVANTRRPLHTEFNKPAFCIIHGRVQTVHTHPQTHMPTLSNTNDLLSPVTHADAHGCGAEEGVCVWGTATLDLHHYNTQKKKEESLKEHEDVMF